MAVDAGLSPQIKEKEIGRTGKDKNRFLQTDSEIALFRT